MIIWSGKGYISAVVIFFDSFFAEIITRNITKDDAYYQNNILPLGCSFIVSALILKLISNFLVKKEKEKLNAVDSDRTPISQKDSLFFIPLLYWPVISLVMGLAIITYQFYGRAH